MTDAIHESCGGKFLPIGIALLSNPPQYPHVCDTCGAKKTFKSRYPLTTLERFLT